MTVVTIEDIQGVLSYFSKNTYRAKDADTQITDAMQLCIDLFKLDYSHFVINNASGELSSHYPRQLIILEYEQHAYSGSPALNSTTTRTTNTIYESTYDVQKLRDLINKARFARCRARFPLPVILYKGKYVCRSATLSGGPEIYGRSGLDYLFFGSENAGENEEPPEGSVESEPAVASQSDWQLFNRVRSQDIKLLKTLNVGTIIDFMVEKKKVKFGMNVTSSEKVDKENRYVDFTIISLPYPGCEFFREFRENDYTAEGLVFDWSQGHVDANIGVPEDPITAQLKIEWDKYKVWDLVTITQNYMRLLLKYLQDSSSGILIHCISGWDRTPLFVSLVRLSLWADGVIHQSLDHAQILYLTIAYDWMLFGHNLVDRLGKGEDIFFFCFFMLKHLIDDEFSITGCRVKSSKHSGSSCCSGMSVNRTDSDTHLDGLLLEQDSRGSNVSLNSSCSSVSTKSQELPPVWFQINQEEIHNGNSNWTNTIDMSQNAQISVGGWSPQNRRTSPVTVPVSSRIRQRQESSSSLSVGSWQMITGTGSLRGSDSTSTIDSNNSNANRCEGQISQDSSCTLVDEDCFLSTSNSEGLSLRKERLEAVRALFYNAYCTAIGFKLKNGPDSSIGTFLGNFAERVGLGQRTSV